MIDLQGYICPRIAIYKIMYVRSNSESDLLDTICWFVMGHIQAALHNGIIIAVDHWVILHVKCNYLQVILDRFAPCKFFFDHFHSFKIRDDDAANSFHYLAGVIYSWSPDVLRLSFSSLYEVFICVVIDVGQMHW